MAVLLGGRAAEQVVFSEVSTGASDDLVRATDIARAMVLRYGMSETLGHVAYERETCAVFCNQICPCLRIVIIVKKPQIKLIMRYAFWLIKRLNAQLVS